MSFRLKKGEAVGMPPAGHQELASDSAGNAFLLNEDGTRVSITGDDPFGRIAFAKSFNPALNDFQLDPLMGTANFFLGGAGGTGKMDRSTIYSGGTYISPGGTGASSGYINWGLADLQEQIMSPGTESWLLSSRVMFPVGSVQSGRWLIPVGIVNNAVTAALMIEAIQAVSATTFKLTIDGNHNAASVAADLGALATLGSATCPVGVFFWISLGFDVATGLVSVWFNDVLVGSYDIMPPNSPCAAMHMWSFDATMRALVSDIFRAQVAA